MRQLRAVAGGKKLETSGVVEQLKDELDKVNKRLKEEKRSLNKYKKDKSKLELKVASYKAQVKQLKVCGCVGVYVVNVVVSVVVSLLLLNFLMVLVEGVFV